MHVQAASSGSRSKTAAVVYWRLYHSPSAGRTNPKKNLPMHPQAISISPEHFEQLQDSLEAISAVSDLLACAGTAIEPGLLHEHTIPRAAALIEREALRVSRLLGIGGDS